jgi:hypothetical protein
MMKIILSRKGFDSSVGKVPSPIFPSGELCSLPIPENAPGSHLKRYEEIKFGHLNLGDLVYDLTQQKINPGKFVHLDPDLIAGSVPRQPGWKPIFGQVGAAERHLQNQDVINGDIFLFYGWFRQVEQCAGIYRYVKNAPDLHVIFGWLQIERRISMINRSKIPSWALDHAHFLREKRPNIESIYIAAGSLQLPGTSINLPGAGVFPKFHPVLCLTDRDTPRVLRSKWRLPPWFYPHGKKSSLSYHEKLGLWTPAREHVLLRSVARGQEFILDCQHYPDAIPWLSNIFSTVCCTPQNLLAE